jgi:F-type H+-transporting ATPase subunit b
MQFDLFTFIATIVNFLVVVVLLRVFLYKRIVGAIDEREQTIEDRWERAETEKQEASRKAEELEEQRQSLESRRQELLDEAKDEAESEKQRLLEEAREEVKRQKEQWAETLQREQERFLAEFRTDMGERLVDILETILQDMADAELEEKIADRFIRHLDSLEGSDRDALSHALQDSEATVHTSHELSAGTKNRVTETVHRVSDSASLRFHVDDELVAGIALVTQERRVEWSVQSYMDEIGQSLAQSVATL